MLRAKYDVTVHTSLPLDDSITTTAIWCKYHWKITHALINRAHYIRQITFLLECRMGRDSSVGIATRYGLDGPGIESWWGARFSASVQTGPEAHPASYTMGTGSFLGVKRLGRVFDHPHPSSAEVKEREELYLYSTSGPSWSVIG